jgi:hypothetical protein
MLRRWPIPTALAVAAIAVNAFGAVAIAGVGRWGPSHRPEGGEVNALVVEQWNAQILYAGTESSVLKSLDAGRHWQASGLELQLVQALALDLKTPGWCTREETAGSSGARTGDEAGAARMSACARSGSTSSRWRSTHRTRRSCIEGMSDEPHSQIHWHIEAEFE